MIYNYYKKAVQAIQCKSLGSCCYQFWCCLCICIKKRKQVKRQGQTASRYQASSVDRVDHQDDGSRKEKAEGPFSANHTPSFLDLEEAAAESIPIPKGNSHPLSLLSSSTILHLGGSPPGHSLLLGSPILSGSPSYEDQSLHHSIQTVHAVAVTPSFSRVSTQQGKSPDSASYRRKPPPPITIPPRRSSLPERKDPTKPIKKSDGMENLAAEFQTKNVQADNVPADNVVQKIVILNSAAIAARPTSPGELIFGTPSSAPDRVIVENSVAKKISSGASAASDSNSSKSSDSGNRLPMLEEQCFNGLNSLNRPAQT